MKNKNLIGQLKVLLDADRYYQESNLHEELFDSILKSNENINIFYINSNKATNCTYFFDEKAVIVWDFQFWDFYQEYLYQAESCIINGFNLKQGISAVSAKYISKKYAKIPTLSHFIYQIYTEFNIPVILNEEKKNKIDRIIFLGKVFSFFHEMGHIEYRKKRNELIKSYQEIILKFYSKLPDSFASLYEGWEDLAKSAKRKIANGEADEVLEEMVCDMFAAGETVAYTQHFFNNDLAGLISDVIIAHDKLISFQALFNAINEAWNNHYAEIKYGITVRTYNIEDRINYLAFDREIIGYALPRLIAKFYDLDIQQIKIIEQNKVKEHIDLDECIECMTQNQFISAAIKESRL